MMNNERKMANKMEFLKHPIMKRLDARFISNSKGEKEEIVFDFKKFQELWAKIEEILYLEEEYEANEDNKIASVILERTKRFSKGQSKSYTQDEIEKMFGAS
jgi:hypothetical protein